jgi:hypothetical protein
MATTNRIIPIVRQDVQKTFTPAEHPHVDLGSPFSSVTQNFLGPSALRLPAKDEFAESEEVYVSGSFQRITSLYDFLESLQVSVSAGFSGTGGGASGSLNFARSLHITEENFYIAAHLRVGKSKQVIRSASFTPDAVKRTPEVFLRAFGDQYCSTVHWGGELVIIYKLYARSRFEQESLDVQFSGHYGGVSASAELSHKVQTLNKDSFLDISIGVWGLAEEIKVVQGDMEQFITSFPQKVKDRGYVTHREFSEYYDVSGAPRNFKLPDISDNKERLLQAAEQTKRIDGLIRDLHYRLQYPFLFEQFDIPGLKSKSQSLVEQRHQIETVARRLVDRWWDLKLRLPEIDPDKIVGKLPEQIPNASLPLIIKIGTKSGERTARNGEFVEAGKEMIEWIHVQFENLALRSSSAPVRISYRVGLVHDNEDDVLVNQMTSYFSGDHSLSFIKDSAIHSLAFKLDGPDANFFDISYEVKMSDKNSAQKGHNDEVIGLSVGRTGGKGPFVAADVRGIKVQVTAKI